MSYYGLKNLATGQIETYYKSEDGEPQVFGGPWGNADKYEHVKIADEDVPGHIALP